MAANPFFQATRNIPMTPGTLGTAAQDVDIRDDLLYSAACLQYGGNGTVQLFNQGIGGSVQAIRQSTVITAPTQAYQTTFSRAYTNLQQAGVLGTVIGNVAIYAIGLDLEQAGIVPTTGVLTATGATQYEHADVAAKAAFVLKIGTTKDASSGPFSSYPTLASVYGSVATSNSGNTSSVASNGLPNGNGRSVSSYIKVTHNQTVSGEIQIANQATLVFRDSTGVGAATMARCICRCAAGMDVM